MAEPYNPDTKAKSITEQLVYNSIQKYGRKKQC